MAKTEIDDRFKKFGTVSFTAITKTNNFVGQLEQGKITGTKCKKCGRTFFPRERIVSSAYPVTWNGLRFLERASF